MNATPAAGDHPMVTSLAALCTELLENARASDAHRAARTIVSSTSLRATLIALTEGSGLAEHDAPPTATLHVLLGRVRLRAGDESWVLETRDLARIPDRRHAVDALTDSVVLLTVALL
jgi:quercetin dioxygenase-like cupin family protein